jgi:hypothetical protein
MVFYIRCRRLGARHGKQLGRDISEHDAMATRREPGAIAAGPAAEIKYACTGNNVCRERPARECPLDDAPRGVEPFPFGFATPCVLGSKSSRLMSL